MADETKDETMTTPAIHSDRLWDGPRWVENLDTAPVWVETKSQYFEELNKRGLRMKDQQESTTGPERELPAEVKVWLQPSPPPDPLTKDEAHLMAAMIAVWKRHGLKHGEFCTTCFSRKRDDFIPVRITDKGVWAPCGCGSAEYHAPTGTTDLVITRFANAPVRERDTAISSVIQGDIHATTTVTFLAPEEAEALRAYAKLAVRRQWELRVYCAHCWDGGLSADHAMGVKITDQEILLLCGCRMVMSRPVSSH